MDKKMIAERYMIISSLGEGGMADVYLAIDTILNREVAIKILRGELSKDPITLVRFQREANAVSKLNHPNVVDVYDVGEFENNHYIVMEYIRGRTLKQLISQRGVIHKEEAINIMIQLTSAVQHAHENNIIHRDIKPQNVLVKDDGTIKITDFGIALAHDAIQLTQSDAVLGSAHYLAPETTRGEVPNNQVDIYALGIVFYELLTGNVPFKGENPVQIAMKHLREEIPSVMDFNPTLPQSIENIILMATVKNLAYRYQSAQEMLKDLHTCLQPEYANVEKIIFEDEQTNATTTLHQARRQKAKAEDQKNKKINKILIIAGSAIVILTILAIVYLSAIFQRNKMITVPIITSDQKQSEAIDTLINNGFKKENIKIKKALSQSVKKGYVISINPRSKEQAEENEAVILTVSRGTYYIVENYKNEELTALQAKLKKENPNLQLIVEKKQMANVYPGRIISQSGLKIGEKLDPAKIYKLHVVVSDYMQFKIEGIVGLPIADAVAKIKQATGVEPILNKLMSNELSEEELLNVKEGIVVSVSPEEGTWYIQNANNTITISYY